MGKDNHYYFICNPAANSGKLKKKWTPLKDEICNYIAKDQFEWIFTQEPLEGANLAMDAAKNGYSHIISVGGDGIANEVCNGLLSSDIKPIFGMIPAGTSNDAHQTHNFPNDPFDALPILFEDKSDTFPVGKVEGDFGDKPHYFIDHCDTGLAALAARSAKYGTKLFKGEWRYTYYALKNLIRFKNNPGQVIVDGEVYEGDFLIAAAGFGDFMSGYNLWPGNNNRKGDFGILLGRGMSRFGILKLMLAAEKGDHIGREGVDYIRGKTMEINLENEWPYQAEGEIFSDKSKSTKITYVPDALTIITNPTL